MLHLLCECANPHLGENNTVGALYTGRFGQSDYRNQVARVDVFLRPASTFTASAQALVSESRYDAATADAFDQPAGSFSGHAVQTQLAYRDRAWWSELHGRLRTPRFRADAGFVPRTDIRGATFVGGYDLRRADGPFTLLQPGFGLWRDESMAGSLLSEGYWLNFYYEGPLQSSAWFNPERRREVFAGETHELLGYWAGVSTRPLPWLRLGISGNFGDEIDFRNGGAGTTVRLSPSFDFQLGRNVELGASHTVQRLDKLDRELFTASINEVRGVFNLNTRAFPRAIVQYRRTDLNPATNPGLEQPMVESLLGQFLLSYKVNPLTVAFLGVTDDRLGFDETTRGHVQLTPRGRTVFFKLGYAWRP